ncbi:nucleotide-binding protein [Teichococcus vastitatis]|uniref:AAA family ATPase n=1 Tax=Teichococcus vastitatis TaxID=2307076 RepID=A0ABS9W323_9PROT|nr:division plane positioning ATPase MipZ [Pseudoroseomonas vastitatis]MCI0753687.1 AAA family ATPase [Pseudoroseomonas vastitatis]
MVGGEKGGVGKTTLATHLAVARKGAGRSVVLVDADSQGTASTWSDARKEHEAVPQLPCVTLRGSKVHVELKELARHYEDIVVDTGGADSQEFRSAMLAADTLLMPLRPGSFDFWTLLKMQEVVAMAEGFNDRLQAVICLSQVPPTASDRARREATTVLAEMPRFRLLRCMTVFRAAFNHSAGEGLTVAEMPRRDPKACSEIAFLHDELFAGAA